jgi:hypothetical protein
MVHQPYSSWLLDEVKLTPEQKAQLETHMLTCTECQPVQQAWVSVKQEIKSSPMASPTVGFTTRWKTYLQIRNSINQRQLAKRWLLGLSLAAVTTLLLLVTQIFTSGSAVTLLLGVSQAQQLVTNLGSQLRNVSWLLFHNASPWIWIILGVGVASWVAISILAGSYIIVRAQRKASANHEN